MGDTNLWRDVLRHIREMEDHQSDLDKSRSHRDREIANIYRNGVSVSEISRRVGLTRTTILRILETQGVKK